MAVGYPYRLTRRHNAHDNYTILRLSRFTRNNENINKFDYYSFKIYVRCGKDSFWQYKDGYAQKKTKTNIFDCKLQNGKSDNLATLQSS